jgi:hypothetical protein
MSSKISKHKHFTETAHRSTVSATGQISKHESKCLGGSAVDTTVDQFG